MNKTTVAAIFSIYGDSFDLNYVTEKMRIKPSETTIKGIVPDGKKRASIETSWSISIEEMVSYDINEQLNQLIYLLESKKEELLLIKDIFEIKFSFLILVKIRNNETPAIYFNIDTLEFINYIKATIDVDLYVC
ncbi:DUF4279 domain-containing protein [Orbaceae bacterium ac157xtp]